MEGDVVALDPGRSYEDRLALTALLEDAHPYPGAGTVHAWPDHRAGIVLQTEWQLASGRATTGSNGQLDGWWPNVNYARGGPARCWPARKSRRAIASRRDRDPSKVDAQRGAPRLPT